MDIIKKFMKKPKSIIKLVFIILILVVLLQNSEQERIDFLFWSISSAKFVIYLCFLVAGIILTMLFNLWKRI